MLSNTEGRVASLHLHPIKSGELMQPVQEIEVVEQKGVRGNPRHFGMRRSNGEPSKRQVSLMEREQISEHAATLGLQSIAPGDVRSNIETTGIDLVALVGKQVQIGEAILYFYEPRTPCEKMDRLCQGLRALMENDKQGVLAQIIKTGAVKVGDVVRVV